MKLCKLVSLALVTIAVSALGCDVPPPETINAPPETSNAPTEISTTTQALQKEGDGATSQDCLEQLKACNQSCDDDPEAGYTCYLDCRTTYWACIITGRGGEAGRAGSGTPATRSVQARQ